MLRSIIISVAFLSLPCAAFPPQIKAEQYIENDQQYIEAVANFNLMNKRDQKYEQIKKSLSEYWDKQKVWHRHVAKLKKGSQAWIYEDPSYKPLSKPEKKRQPLHLHSQIGPEAQLNALSAEQVNEMQRQIEKRERNEQRLPGQRIENDRQYRSVMEDFNLMSVDSPDYDRVRQSLDEYWDRRGLGEGAVAVAADVRKGRAWQLMAELGDGADLEPEQVKEVERTLGKGVVNFYKGLSQEEKDEMLVNGHVQAFVGANSSLGRVYLAQRLGLDTDEAHVMAAELRHQAGVGRAKREQVKKDFEEKINHTTIKQEHTSLIPLSFMNYQFIKDLILLIGPIVYLALAILLIYFFWKYMQGIYIILTSCLNLTKLCAFIYILSLFILGTIIPAIHLTILLVALITLPLLIKHYDKKTALLKQHLPLTSSLPLAPSPNTTTPKIFKIIIATIILAVAYALPAEKDALSYYTLVIQSFILAFSSSLGIFYIIPFSFQTLKKAKQSYLLDSPSKTIAYALIAIASILSWYWTTDWLIHSVTGKDIKDLYTQPYHFKSRIVRYSYSNN